MLENLFLTQTNLRFRNIFFPFTARQKSDGPSFVYYSSYGGHSDADKSSGLR